MTAPSSPAAGQPADPLGVDRVDSDVDELLETAAHSDDSESAVSGADQPHGSLDDPTQHDLEIQALDNRRVRIEQISQTLLSEWCGFDVVWGLVVAWRHRGLPSS